MAATLHGGSYVTLDVDIAFAPDPENLDHLVEALAPFRPRPLHYPEGQPFQWDRLAVAGAFLRLATDAGSIDLMRRLPGVESFAALYERSEVKDLGSFSVRVASLDDLIRMKEGSGRPKDALHLMELEALKDLSQQGE